MNVTVLRGSLSRPPEVRLLPSGDSVVGFDITVPATGDRRAVLGRQPEPLGGAVTWVVPNPSGLNASHQLPDLARWYGQLRS